MSRNPDAPCFVYVIGYKDHPEWPKKIGVATDVASRTAGHQTSNPFELEVLITMPGNEIVEHKLHGHFHHKHVRGEWFNLDDGDLAWLVKLDPKTLPDTIPCDQGEVCQVYVVGDELCPHPALGRIASQVDGRPYCADHLALASTFDKRCDICGEPGFFTHSLGGRLICGDHLKSLKAAQYKEELPCKTKTLKNGQIHDYFEDGRIVIHFNTAEHEQAQARRRGNARKAAGEKVEGSCPECEQPSAGIFFRERPDLCHLHHTWLLDPDAGRCTAGVPHPSGAADPDGGCPYPGSVAPGYDLCTQHNWRLVNKGDVAWKYDALRDNPKYKPTMSRKDK